MISFDKSNQPLTTEITDKLYVKHGYIGEKINGTLAETANMSFVNNTLTITEGIIQLSKGSYIIFGQLGVICNRLGTLSSEISISTSSVEVDKKFNTKNVNVVMKKGDIITINITAVIDVVVETSPITMFYLMGLLKFSTGDFTSQPDYFNFFAVRVS